MLKQGNASTARHLGPPLKGNRVNRPRILLAVLPVSVPRYRAALEVLFDVHAVDSLAAADAAFAREHFDLVVCGVHFSDSQMPSLLQRCKSDEAMRDAPFFCIRAITGELPEVMYRRLRYFVVGMGGRYLDLQALEKQLGFDAAAAVLRKRILDVLPVSPKQTEAATERACVCADGGED